MACLQFGEIDIDSELVVSKDTLPDSGDQIMMLNNGCLCCSVKEDLVQMLNDLVSSFIRFKVLFCVRPFFTSRPSFVSLLDQCQAEASAESRCSCSRCDINPTTQQ